MTVELFDTAKLKTVLDFRMMGFIECIQQY